jgi:endonuclease YncB( thermonuclease family)
VLRTLAVLIALLPALTLADVTGQASVIDGDTLEIHGQRIRLHGIDAPESGQLCHIGGKRWRCGKVAANVLAGLISRRRVTCQERDRDRCGRVVAVCRVQGENLGAWLVGNGLASA